MEERDAHLVAPSTSEQKETARRGAAQRNYALRSGPGLELESKRPAKEGESLTPHQRTSSK
jgi:hypothetical protein